MSRLSMNARSSASIVSRTVTCSSRSASRRVSNWSCSRGCRRGTDRPRGRAYTVKECPLHRAASRSARTSAAGGPPSARAAPASPSGRRARRTWESAGACSLQRPHPLRARQPGDRPVRRRAHARGVLRPRARGHQRPALDGAPAAPVRRRPRGRGAARREGAGSCSTPPPPSDSRPARPSSIALDGLRRRRARALRPHGARRTGARATSSSSRSARTRCPRRTARRVDDAAHARSTPASSARRASSPRCGWAAARSSELKRIVFAPPPRDD